MGNDLRRSLQHRRLLVPGEGGDLVLVKAAESPAIEVVQQLFVEHLGKLKVLEGLLADSRCGELFLPQREDPALVRARVAG